MNIVVRRARRRRALKAQHRERVVRVFAFSYNIRIMSVVCVIGYVGRRKSSVFFCLFSLPILMSSFALVVHISYFVQLCIRIHFTDPNAKTAQHIMCTGYVYTYLICSVVWQPASVLYDFFARTDRRTTETSSYVSFFSHNFMIIIIYIIYFYCDSKHKRDKQVCKSIYYVWIFFFFLLV